MFRRHAMVWRLRHLPPLAVLAIVAVVSLGARAALLEQPCRNPCRAATDHVLVFDESYYVNAARVIAGVRLAPSDTYAGAPSGSDPNAEHPQLAKLIIAGSIDLFGDGPFAWRLGSLLFGTLALLGMYALVRAAGGSAPLALGAAALMAADNLLLVHGRIGTLDIYVVAVMIWAVTLYLGGHPLGAGVLLAIGSCMKLVAPYALFVLVLLELIRGRGWRALLMCAVSGVLVFFGLLALLDMIARPYDPVTGTFVSGGAFGHLSHMLSYAASQSSPHGPTGIASYPWEWLVDYKPIVYLNINPARPAPGLIGIHPAAHFLGMINPALMLLAVPALILAARRIRRDDLDALAVAWFAGTWTAFELASLIWSRTSYLYYMVIVMPGIYIAVAQLLGRGQRHRVLVGIWIALLVAGAVVMFPFTPVP